jgi:hypothetical protein
MGIILGTTLLTATLAITQTWISSNYGLFINVNVISNNTLYFFVGILSLAALLALAPAIMAYRYSLAKI